MTDEIKTEQQATTPPAATPAATAPAKQKGKPPMKKRPPVKIHLDYSAPAPATMPAAPAPIKRAGVKMSLKPTDQWAVEGKDPRFYYSWGRKSNDREMNIFAQRGYIPATGNERIARNPFEATQDEEGKTKERGDRILMCCPKELVAAREKDRLSRHRNAKQAAANDARRMMHESGGGAIVQSDASETTKTESMEE